MNYPCFDNCGACCKRIGFLVIASVNAIQKSPEPVPDIVHELAEFPYDINDDGSCSQFDATTSHCKVYETRPLVCNVQAMYEKYFKPNGTTEEEYMVANTRSCLALRGQKSVKIAVYDTLPK